MEFVYLDLRERCGDEADVEELDRFLGITKVEEAQETRELLAGFGEVVIERN